jgi:hypothetical protein
VTQSEPANSALYSRKLRNSAKAHLEACRFARRCFLLAFLPCLRLVRSRMGDELFQADERVGMRVRYVLDF